MLTPRSLVVPAAPPPPRWWPDRRHRHGPVAGARETAAIREWAHANGHDVSARGRIPSTVLAAYADRGNAPVTEPAVEAAVEADATPKRRTRRKTAATG